LIFTYPELQELKKDKKLIIHTDSVEKALQEASLRYLGEGRDYRSDLIKFRDHLKAQKKAPKSISIAISGATGFLGRNKFRLDKYDKQDPSRTSARLSPRIRYRQPNS
jgi:hypothetical protein